MVACDLSLCSQRYLGRKCKCYTTLDDIQLRGLPKEERVRRINSEQFCAFEGDDGFLYGCDKGCCEGGCPGQCEAVEPRPPVGVYIKPEAGGKGPSISTWPVLQLVLLLAFVLILLAILSLYA